jgi:signal transduction histidine kinase
VSRNDNMISATSPGLVRAAKSETAHATSETAHAMAGTGLVTPPESAHTKTETGLVTPSESAQDATQKSTQMFSTGPAERWAYQWVDRRLKVLSVLLPVGFILALEFVHYKLQGEDPRFAGFWGGYRPLFVVITLLSIVAFGLVMFRFIDRAQQQVVRQNRELAATNALSSAVQGEVGVDRIIDVALESVLTTSGAVRASVTIFSTEDRSPEGAGVTRLLAAPDSALLTANEQGARAGNGGYGIPSVDLPLSTGTMTVGRMRLWLPTSVDAGDRLASGTLANIGHQLASAIQLAQLVADLQRRKHEGHAFYDVLLQISNQLAPPDILSGVVAQARDLMGSDEAVLSLDEEAARSVQLAGTMRSLDGTGTVADGTACIVSQVGPHHEAHGPQVVCSVRSSPDWLATMAVPIRGPIGTLGELWIGRRSPTPFTDRDEAFLITLSGLAAIAITSAQMREAGRQRAVIAERGRIAREMHDSLAQVLGVTHLRLRALDARTEVRDNPEIAKELSDVADICQEAYQDVRESILGLRGSNTTERGLLGNLRAYLDKYTQQCGIKTSLDSELDHELGLSPRCEVQVIRVIQEALTNVRKHSGAKSVTVRITEAESTTTFVVEDDGQGFDQQNSPTDRDGFGLFTMSERMGLLNGSFTIDSAPGHGTRVIADVPERSRPRPAPVEVTDAGI